ncbi:hypothetical protein RUM44_011753 [Polyplax serrata]|uniref:Uncharacterized protein n=1 Tax=Polyplax serrata TaxID=468196 RepID=A0ABR1ASE9_POLSC
MHINLKDIEDGEIEIICLRIQYEIANERAISPYLWKMSEGLLDLTEKMLSEQPPRSSSSSSSVFIERELRLMEPGKEAS